MKTFLGVEQKKGDPGALRGKLIAYARVEKEGTTNSPLDEMIRDGILAVGGNYREQRSLKDFLEKEFRGAMEQGMEGLLEQLEGMSELPGGIDSDSLKKKLESFTNMEMIPVPAQVVFFDDEAALLTDDSDIFYLGSFVGASNAHLMVTSFPILYQAVYREQEASRLSVEITEMLGQVETDFSKADHPPIPQEIVGSSLFAGRHFSDFGRDLESFLQKEVLPQLIYSLHDSGEFSRLFGDFRNFMKGYTVSEDLDILENGLQKLQDEAGMERRLELICRKIAALHNEDFEKLQDIQRELDS